MATYDIDLLRALFVDKLNDSSIFLASFYEQLQDDEQITRYVDSIKELIALQNREKTQSNYKAMGIIAQSGNAEIINLKTNYISPLEYQARFDIELNDRDYVLNKIKTLIDDLRGRKFDVLLMTNGSVRVLKANQIDTTLDKRTIGVDLDKPVGLSAQHKNFMYINGSYNPLTATTDWSNDIFSQYASIPATGVDFPFQFIVGDDTYGYKLYERTIRLVSTSPNVYTYGTAIDLGDIEGRYKISLSFNGIQSQEPYINNGLDRVFLFFSGSATIVHSKVALGNDIVLTTIQVGKNTGTKYEVEPTEIPASLSVNDDTYQTYANGYRTQDRNMAVGNKMAYSFVFDTTNALLSNLYEYARYGFYGTSSTYAQTIFTIKEYRLAYGKMTVNTFYAKLGDVATSNTNGDVMTLSVNLKVGDY